MFMGLLGEGIRGEVGEERGSGESMHMGVGDSILHSVGKREKGSKISMERWKTGGFAK